MADLENHFTVFIRLPFNRGDFVDPPPVAWSAAKERDLWETISRATRDNEIDWKGLAHHFQVSDQFLLQQSAWLYERQLSQVRAQMRRMGNGRSATGSPVSSSATASVVGTQSTKRPSAPASRGPSRLSTQTSIAVGGDTSTPSTPQRSRTSLPFKSTAYAGSASQARAVSGSARPLSRKSSKDNELPSRTHSRRGSVQQQPMTRSPGEPDVAESSTDEDDSTAKTTHRRPNPATNQRKSAAMRRSQHIRQSPHSAQHLQNPQEEDEDEDDGPAFLPFAATRSSNHADSSAPTIDPSATLRGGLSNPTTKPVLRRNHTSERVKPGTSAASTAPKQRELEPPIASSASSLSSNNAPSAPPPRPQYPHTAAARRSPANLPIPLSPRQQAALAAAAGLSPRRRSTNPHHTGSESSPSMGSSFSDLDDASVTQSALEEALMSNMGSTTAMAGGMGALGSRVSGISQALRSRYFDARTGSGAGQGEQQSG